MRQKEKKQQQHSIRCYSRPNHTFFKIVFFLCVCPGDWNNVFEQRWNTMRRNQIYAVRFSCVVLIQHWLTVINQRYIYNTIHIWQNEQHRASWDMWMGDGERESFSKTNWKQNNNIINESHRKTNHILCWIPFSLATMIETRTHSLISFERNDVSRRQIHQIKTFPTLV